MPEPTQPERHPDLIDSDTGAPPRSGSEASADTDEAAGPLTRLGRWVVRRRVPLVLIPSIAGLVVVGGIGARMLLEDIPEPEAVPPPVICWDDSQAAEADDCSMPTGVEGLEWVFPSFARSREDCRDLLQANPDSPRPTAWECPVALSNGAAVTVTYLELADVQAGRIFFDKRFQGSERSELTGPNGSVYRYEWRRPMGNGFELAAAYADFPYAVTVSSGSAAFRERAFSSRVSFRQPARIAVQADATAEGASPEE